jgi:hypothetical protein
MAHAPHSHHHPHPVIVPVSLLRMSAWERLTMTAVIIAVLWAAAFWAMA